MYVKNFVICDTEQQYSKNLIQLLTDKRENHFQMYLFHTPEEVLHFSGQKKIHLLLIDEACPGELRMKIPAEQKFVLVKGPCDFLSKEETGVYRYQSAEKIWLEVAGGEEETEFILSSEIKAEGELIAVYSPVHRIGKTRFAIELGQRMAQERPVLYLNLETYSGMAPHVKALDQADIGDLLYYVRQEKTNIGFRISTMVQQDNRLDRIAPMSYLQDLQAVSCEEWLKLFDQILEQSIYEKIILDLGDGINGLFRILEKCTVIYTPYIEEKTAKAKLNQYTEDLRRTGFEKILEKTVQKRMRTGREGKKTQESEGRAII